MTPLSYLTRAISTDSPASLTWSSEVFIRSKAARTSAAPDLAMTVRELGALYLGGVSATTLARAGRVAELTRGALARADRFFCVSPAPWCGTHF